MRFDLTMPPMQNQTSIVTPRARGEYRRNHKRAIRVAHLACRAKRGQSEGRHEYSLQKAAAWKRNR
jgi:hypothetical protein